jgi:flagellar capping protein FliD
MASDGQVGSSDPASNQSNNHRTSHTDAEFGNASAVGVPSNDGNYSLMEVSRHLQVNPELVRSWSRRFAKSLSAQATAEPPRYNSADVAALVAVRQMVEKGSTDEQVIHSLLPRRIEPQTTAMALAPLHVDADEGALSPAQALGDVFTAIASGQQTVLNSQSAMRELVSVVVQDNFNLKDENRKLRDRMLELERALAEYQRREESRKERLESRLRALEGTVAALQQQLSQMVQLQRSQQKKRGLW